MNTEQTAIKAEIADNTAGYWESEVIRLLRKIAGEFPK